MHVNSEVVDTAGFSAFFAQARQSRPGEVTWKPERCSWVQFRPSEKCFVQARGYSRPSKGIVAQARMTLKQVYSLDSFRPSKIIFGQVRGFSLKLYFRPS